MTRQSEICFDESCKVRVYYGKGKKGCFSASDRAHVDQHDGRLFLQRPDCRGWFRCYTVSVTRSFLPLLPPLPPVPPVPRIR